MGRRTRTTLGPVRQLYHHVTDPLSLPMAISWALALPVVLVTATAVTLAVVVATVRCTGGALIVMGAAMEAGVHLTRRRTQAEAATCIITLDLIILPVLIQCQTPRRGAAE